MHSPKFVNTIRHVSVCGPAENWAGITRLMRAPSMAVNFSLFFAASCGNAKICGTHYFFTLAKSNEDEFAISVGAALTLICSSELMRA